MLYLLLYPLHTQFSIFNVFRYLSFRIIYAAITAFAPCISRPRSDAMPT